MYEKFYGLKDRPFKLPPDPEYLFLSRQHRLALVHLEYGLEHQAGFVVITGDIGTGKTTLIKTLLRRLSKDTLVATIFNTTVGPDEFLALILSEFELDANIPPGHQERLDLLNEFLISCYAGNRTAVLIVDEAQNLGLETLEELRLLSNLQTEKDYLIHIILVGQPELKEKLTNPALRQLAQRISVHYHLRALDEQETSDYIVHRLKKSGSQDPFSCISADAMHEIYRYSKGIPRLINLLCDACLVNGFADEIRPVTAALVTDTIKGDGAGKFWDIANPQVTTQAQRATRTPGPKSNSTRQRPYASLESRIFNLERHVLTLSRLVSEQLVAMNPGHGNKGAERERILLDQLEAEKVKVKRLEAERDELKKRLKEISGRLEAAESGKGALKAQRGNIWRFFRPREDS